ncbi:PIN domain-like protein [Artomyces pyxidatus]|uniref:PIN domain-like protein n=1 Tax=Artomyces pyxidatus TaxID=48021 RepID=A0ACB8TBE4_9AGAM|nr:PIN domain-like protein [Artomyces pyxidatus]
MGVAGLWDILRPAGKPRSLTHLAVVDGFEANSSNLRGLRIGIDASIWFFHAAYGREGENPELRTLFFRCTRLLSMPFLPLFVFDGPKRPSVKRGKRITGNQHWLTNGMKEIIEAFGFEWRMAPGEAEAELAYLNDIGVIDAILSDDVDNFLFGAKMVVRNPNSTLSGNRGHIHKNADGRDDGNHSIIYKSQDLLSHPSILLSRGGLILIGLLSGGDYDEAGLDGCGPAIAHGLAKCGFGEQLLEATRSFDRDELANFLVRWRQSVREELRTNSRGYLGKKKPTLAKAVTEDFPDIDILLNYTNPITSGTDASARRTHVPPKWDREPDLGKIAHLCEVHFEWGMKDIIIKRFRTVLWPSMVLRILRRATLEADIARRAHRGVPGTPVKRVARDHVDIIGTPSKMLARYFSSVNLAEDTCLRSEEPPEGKLIVKIHSKRTHASTDGILEYRLEIAPAQLVHLSAAGVQGIRKPADTTYDVVLSDDEDDEDEGGPADGGRKGKKKASGPVNPESHLRIWMPASMVQQVRPDLVEAYEATAEKRLAKKAGTSRAAVAGGKAKGRSKKATTLADDEDDEIFDLNEGVLSVVEEYPTEASQVSLQWHQQASNAIADNKKGYHYHICACSLGLDPSLSQWFTIIVRDTLRGRLRR